MRPLLALLCLAAGVGVAGVAQADPDTGGVSGVDPTAFLDSLQAAGIGFSRTELVIETAETVCKLVGGGMSGPDVLAALKSRNPGLTTEHGAQFLAIAMRSYCPDRLAGGEPGTAG